MSIPYLDMNSKRYPAFSVHPAPVGSNLAWNTIKRTTTRRRKRKIVPCNCCSTYKNILFRHFRNYCEEASLHGIRNIIDSKNHQIEKLLWLVVCVSCVSVAISMMRLVWSRFEESPTVTNVETTNYPIWNIPFPAVTLCNNNQVYEPAAKRLVANLSQQLQINSSILLQVLKMLPKLIMPTDINMDDVEMVEKKLLEAGYDIQDLMIKLAVPCEKMLLKCMWLDETRNCSDLFHISKSVKGICCSFNYFGLKKEYRIDKPNENEGIHYVSGAGNVAGLTLVLNIDENTYFAPMRPLVAIMVLFHDPMHYPETSMDTTMVEPQRMVTVSLGAQAVESVPEVQTLSVAQRQCWFSGEETVLRSSDKYNYETCITECRIKVLNDKCGCVPFFYPLFNESARVCTLLDTRCLRLNRRITAGLQPREFENDFGGNSRNDIATGMNCSCLPRCTDKTYIISTDSVTLKPQFFSSELIQKNNTNLSVLHVNFGDITCMKYSRNAYMTWDAVFATFGGIFGLCMGGSVISLFELSYRLVLLLVACIRVLLCRKPQRQPENAPPWSMHVGKSQLKLSQSKDPAKMFRNWR